MFNAGFFEIAVIGVVALIVLGPERLPKVARTVGIMLGRLQRYVDNVKSDINREIQLDELKRLQEQLANQAREMESSMKTSMSQVETNVSKEVKAIENSLNDTVAALTGHASSTAEPGAVNAANSVEVAETAASGTVGVVAAAVVSSPEAATAQTDNVPASVEEELYYPVVSPAADCLAGVNAPPSAPPAAATNAAQQKTGS